MTSEKDIITGTKKLGMTANVDSDGRLAAGIHSVRGQDYPEGSVTVRTKADDPDPSPCKVPTGVRDHALSASCDRQ